MVKHGNVMTSTSGGRPREIVLRELVRRVGASGWLDVSGRVVVQVGACGRSAVAADTARALANGLAAHSASARVELLAAGAGADDLAGLPRLALERGDAVRVAVAGGAALDVPAFWFESAVLVTIATVHRDRRWRIGGVLEAQAEALGALNPRLPAATLLAEAHRLGASDLAVACVTRSDGQDWWAVGRSDTEVEAVMAQEAGIDPATLPSLRAIARHELLEPCREPRPAGGALRDLAGGGLGPVLAEARERGAAAGRRVLEDLGLISRNARKVPQAVRRRLAARAGWRRSA